MQNANETLEIGGVALWRPREVDLYEFEASLVYIASSRLGRATW